MGFLKIILNPFKRTCFSLECSFFLYHCFCAKCWTFSFLGVPKPGLEYQRISVDRSKLTEDEAFEHAIEMISSRQMGFRKAADFFQVSKWKLYKTARKRGIYAEIKKQNQAHVSSFKFCLIGNLTKVYMNFSFLKKWVYKY